MPRQLMSSTQKSCLCLRAPRGAPLQHCPGYVSTHFRSWWTSVLLDTQSPFPPRESPYVGSCTCRCCGFGHVSEWPSPRTQLGRPARPLPHPLSHTHSTCPWSHSEVILPVVPVIFPCCTSSIICSCALQDKGALPSLKFCSNMLRLTSGWPHYCCHLGILFADLNIPSQLRHPPARLLPHFRLTISACLLIPLGLRIHLRFFQSQKRVIAG
jgi:hypothetical protein